MVCTADAGRKRRSVPERDRELSRFSYPISQGARPVFAIRRQFSPNIRTRRFLPSPEIAGNARQTPPPEPRPWFETAHRTAHERCRCASSSRCNLRLANCPSRHRIRGHVGRLGNLHQDGLTCGCDFDSALLESSLHAAVEFALHWPATAVGAANLADDRGHRAVHLVDAPQFEIAADRLPVFGLATHFSDDVLKYLAGAVGIFLVGNVDADGRIAGTTA